MSDINLTELRERFKDACECPRQEQNHDELCLSCAADLGWLAFDTYAALIDTAEAAMSIADESWFQIRSEGSAFVLRESLSRYRT